MFFRLLFSLLFLFVSDCCADQNDLWVQAWHHGCYDDIQLLQPTYNDDKSVCFVGLYFKNSERIPVDGFERFPINTLMDVNCVYGSAIDNAYGFICASNSVTDDSLFDLLTTSKLFRVNMNNIDRFCSGYCLTCNGSDYFFERQKDENFDDHLQIENASAEKKDEKIPVVLDSVHTKLDQTVAGDLVYLEVCVYNDTHHDVMVVPSKMLYQFGCTNAIIVKKATSKTLFFPRICRYYQSVLGNIGIPDFYRFDNHVLIYALPHEGLEENNDLTNCSEDKFLKVKYIACVPLEFNCASEVRRHISKIQVEQSGCFYSVDSQVL